MEVKMKINYILAGCVLAVGMLAVGAIALGIFTVRSRSQNNTIENPMVKVYEDSNSTIWYDKDTMVMYYERNCTYCVEITVMVNADGTPKLYKEEN
jgi:thioredoxin-related protein